MVRYFVCGFFLHFLNADLNQNFIQLDHLTIFFLLLDEENLMQQVNNRCMAILRLRYHEEDEMPAGFVFRKFGTFASN